MFLKWKDKFSLFSSSIFISSPNNSSTLIPKYLANFLAYLNSGIYIPCSHRETCFAFTPIEVPSVSLETFFAFLNSKILSA